LYSPGAYIYSARSSINGTLHASGATR